MDVDTRRVRSLLWGIACFGMLLSCTAVNVPAAAEEVATLESFATVLRSDPTSRAPIEILIKLHFQDLTTAQLRAISQCTALERLEFRPPADRLVDKPVNDLPTLVKHLLPLKTMKSLAIGLAKPRLGGPRVVRDDDLAVLAQLTNLEELDFSRQPLTGVGLKHLIGLPKLESLNLDETAVGEEAFEGLSKLPQLKQLSLRNTSLNAVSLLSFFLQKSPVELPEVMVTRESADLRNKQNNQLNLRYHLARYKLKALHIQSVRDEDLELLADQPTLEFLHISSYGKLTDKGLRWLPGQQQLRVLNIENTDLTAGHLKVLAELPHLQVLHIGASQLDDGTVYLGAILGLRELYVAQGRYGYKNLAGIAKCKWLERLSIESGLSAGDLEFLSGLENLQHLSLREIDFRGVLHLSRPERLQHLAVVNWHIVEPEQWQGLAKVANLESLTLVASGLSAADCLPAIAHLKKLQSLKLLSSGRPSKMPMRDQVRPFMELAELQKLELGSVEIGPEGFAALASLPKLQRSA